MNLYNATEMAYKNGYKQGYSDAQCANSKICNGCVCKPVCAVFNATGGVAQCRYFYTKESK